MDDLGGLMQQVMNMKAQLESAKENMVAEYSAAGVTVAAKGDFTITNVTVSDELAASGDAERIADAVQIATNGAFEKIRKQFSDQLGAMGVPPGLF